MAVASPKTLRLKITGPVAIHNRRPGAEFTVAADADGVPLDPLWRKRLADEARHGIGAVTVIADALPESAPTSAEAAAETVAPAPTLPPVSPPPARKR